MSMRSPIIRTVVSSVQRLYPTALADKSWDNTGLLLESPPLPTSRNVVLLAIDLTRAVADEAIRLKTCAVVAYHPIIFRGLMSLTYADPQQETLLRLAREGISVYSPHTAVDAVRGGVNDWLADVVGKGERRVIVESKALVEGFEGSGMGRVVTLDEEVPVMTVVDRVKKGVMKGPVMVALAARHRNEEALIKTVALCAGSGGSMFKGLDADLYFTGELSHHEALAAVEKGISVITCFHSNTERGFLTAVMRQKLQTVLAEEWEKVPAQEKAGREGGFEVVVSAADRDPFEIM